jgi:calcineurin-like phosphoesterase family protein
MSFTKKFYTSDTHFGHVSLLSMQPRPFVSIDEHDEHLVEQWNRVVGNTDIVYHLGDFAMGLTERADRVRRLFSRLNGRKRLVVGNHDLDRHGHLHPTLAALDWDEAPQGFIFTDDCGQKLVLAHYAQRVWQWESKGGYHFYGHAHGQLPGIGRSRDVGVDMPDTCFAPRTFSQLQKSLPLPCVGRNVPKVGDNAIEDMKWKLVGQIAISMNL